MKRHLPRTLGALLLFLAVTVPLTACGSSGNSGAGELARQRELAAARRQAAEDARQSAHIEELERKLKQVGRGGRQAQTTTTTTTAPSPPPASTNLGDWPSGSGYTAILASLSSEAEARSTQRQASDRGLDAGVLYSSNFSSLRPGYWVVFSGSFGTEQEAVARTGRARELGYSDAYPRFVAP